MQIQKYFLTLQRNVKYNSLNMKDKMKRQNVFFAAALCGLMSLVSCTEEVMNEQLAKSNSQLSVVTRAGNEAVLALPVQLYIFNAASKCVAAQTIESGNSMTPVWLPEGVYSICAIGGADDTHYTLPSQETATPETGISLKENQALTDLMAFSTQVDLADGAQEELTITLGRQVLKLKDITIREVPEKYTSVSVQISKLYETLLVNGTPSGTNGSITVNLIQDQTNNTLWKLENEAYLLPSNGKPTITVSFKTGSETKSYVYTCKEVLPANYKLTIDGTYNSKQGVTISGTITGAVWSGEKTIALTFNEKDDNTTGEENTTTDDNNGGGNSGGGESGNGNGNENPSGGNENNNVTLPAVGSLYHTCYVFDVNSTTNTITVLAPERKNQIVTTNETQTSLSSKTTNELSTWSYDGITDWTLPNKSQLEAILNNNSNIISTLGINLRQGSGIGSTNYLFIDTDGKIKAMASNKDTSGVTINDASYILGVKSITITE